MLEVRLLKSQNIQTQYTKRSNVSVKGLESPGFGAGSSLKSEYLEVKYLVIGY